MRHAGSLAMLIALLLFALQAEASMRCEHGIAKRGDRTFEVERLCGEPDLREPLELTVAGDGTVITSVERWYYNHGPRRLVRMVDFRDGSVLRFQSGGYGYREFPGTLCAPRLLQRGMTRMELLGECGPPDAQQTLPPTRPRVLAHPHAFQRSVPAREEWYYEFGPGQLSRIVTLESGRVIRVEQGRRTR